MVPQESPPPEQRRSVRYDFGAVAELIDLWSIVCHNRNFCANFFGRVEDIRAFYSVLQHTIPTI